ncbi:MAG: sulfatase [Bacteroidales bacterium]
MKNLLVYAAILLLIPACSGGTNKASDENNKKNPNLLMIIVDDLTTTLGCYEHPMVKTPNIDRLAEEGVLFEHAYCNYAVCGPSRSSFLSGLYPESINVLDNRKGLQDELGERITLPDMFRRNGYYTMSLGKIFHTMKEEHNDYKAWDEIYGFSATEIGKKGESRNMTGGELKWCWWQATEGDDEDQPDGQVAAKAVEFIKADHDKPFFLAVGFHKPHDPFIAPKKYFDMYPLEECDPHLLPEEWSPPYPHTLPGQTEIFNSFTEQDKREFLRSYYACTSFMDAQLGKVIKALKESGQYENTLIMFFGDHGYHLGEHNWWNKVTIFELGTRAPFIVAGKGITEKGVRSGSMFEFIDIYPTLADYMEIEDVPDHLEGKSFAAVMKDPSLPFRSEVRAIVNRGKMIGRTVKNSEWRYTEWDEGKKGRELYDQVKDPIEYNNLAEKPEYKELVSEMRELLYKE